MNRLALASALSLASTLMIAPLSLASGFIVVDTAVTPAGGFVVPIRPAATLHPGHTIIQPGVTPTTPPTLSPPAVLKGGVSFGLHLQSEQIKVEINDQVAKTYIIQTFMNDTDRVLAGTYLFPLPEDTTFSSFSLHIDGKPVEGKILEAQEARLQYEQIVRSMIDPGLLEYADYKTVRARIFPIPPHGTKKVELEYTQVLKAENGMLKYRFPLKAEGESVPVEEVKIDAKLASQQGLRTIWSPTHTINTARDDNNKAKVSMVSHEVIPDKDFLLYYSVSNKDMAANLLTHKNSGEDGYFLLTLTPPVKASEIAAKDVVLVADTSGSMLGDKLQQAKKSLKYIVGALNADDKFNIVQFNTDVEPFKDKLVVATDENKKAAEHFIDELEARGGTNIGDALHMGTTVLGDTSERPAYLVMLTDGEPTVGETSIAGLIASVKSKRDIRLFDFGVGYDVNTKLLDQIAEEHHGTSQYVEPKENLETALSNFYQKIKSPVLTNVAVKYSGVEVKDFYPREVKDIFAGSQILLLGKYKNGGKATIELTGKLNGVEKEYTFPLTFESTESAHSYLPRLWAMRRIGHLTAVAQENGNNREVVDEIVELSQKYGIITNYTSFLVTDPIAETHGRAMSMLQPAFTGIMPPNGHGYRKESGGNGARFDFAPSTWGNSSSDLRNSSIDLGGGQRLKIGGTVHVVQSPDASNTPLPWVPAIPQNDIDLGNSGIGANATPVDWSIRARKGGQATSQRGATRGVPRSGAFGGYQQQSSVQTFGPAAGHGLPFGVPSGPTQDFGMAYANFPTTGATAVANSKAINNLLQVDKLAKADESGGIKAVDDKTFYLRNGVWVDSAYDDKMKPEVITFGTDQYFDLLHKNPGIAKYLAVGKEVIFVFNGHTYKIVATATS